MPELVAGNRVHQCSVCGLAGPWTESWSWYGSEIDLEDGQPILKICGDDCMITIDENGGPTKYLRQAQRAARAAGR